MRRKVVIKWVTLLLSLSASGLDGHPRSWQKTEQEYAQHLNTEQDMSNMLKLTTPFRADFDCTVAAQIVPQMLCLLRSGTLNVLSKGNFLHGSLCKLITEAPSQCHMLVLAAGTRRRGGTPHWSSATQSTHQG